MFLCVAELLQINDIESVEQLCRIGRKERSPVFVESRPDFIYLVDEAILADEIEIQLRKALSEYSFGVIRNFAVREHDEARGEKSFARKTRMGQRDANGFADLRFDDIDDVVFFVGYFKRDVAQFENEIGVFGFLKQ